MIKIFFSVIAVVFILSKSYAQVGFVHIENQKFMIGDAAYNYIGTNVWYGMHLGSAGPKGDRMRLVQELDQLQSLGITNLRIMATSEGANPYQNTPTLQPEPGSYNKELLEGLDYFLVEIGKRNMKAVVCLGNFWMWSGGFAQYVSWANDTDLILPDIDGGGSWDDFIQYALSFYANKNAMRMYRDHVKFIINRTNSISGVAYKKDPTIMSWQLSNEPRGYEHNEAYRAWIAKTATLIKKKDKNHLVCIGSEGSTNSKNAGIDLWEDNQSVNIDYATTHVWIQNWGWFDPNDTASFDAAVAKSIAYLNDQNEIAKKLKKPLVIEEFGVSRNGGAFTPGISTSFRDKYFQQIFEYTLQRIQNKDPIQGCNFWSWGGQEKATRPGGFWKEGDSLIGDPAHERQGWYSVYHDDSSTLKIIKKYTEGLDTISPVQKKNALKLVE